MKKNFLQDVVPANHKRSIRDIPLPKHREAKSVQTVQESIAPKRQPASEPEPAYATPAPTASGVPFENKEAVFNPQHLHAATYEQEEHQEAPEAPENRDSYATHDFGRNVNRSGRSGKKLFVTFLLVGALIGGVFLFGRTKAEVTLYPKGGSYEVDVNVPVSASSTIATQTQITKTQSVTLEATSEQQVEKQASGRIRIINLHEETPQELVKNTRFQTADGLVYRIKDSISIPGYKVVNGSNVPGTLEVDVYADSAGEEYNIGMTKFTIPGFSGMPQFDKITAESVTVMTGGYIGIKKVVSKDAEDDAYDELKAKLEAEFTSQPIITDTEVTVPDTDTVVFGELVDEVNGNSVTLKLSASATAYTFNKQNLTNLIGQRTVAGSGSEDSFKLDPQALTFTKDSDTIIVTGNTQITWLTDIEKLKAAIAGKKRSEIVEIMSGYQSIEKADLKLDPFWKTKFPTKTDKISVEVTE